MYDLRKLIARSLEQFERQFSERDRVGATGLFSRLQTRRPSLAVKLLFYKPGWLLLVGVTSLAILSHLVPSEMSPPVHVPYLAVLVVFYALYTSRLESVSRRQPDVYDDAQFRQVRITINLLFASAVVAISGGAHSYFWFIFLYPLLQGVTYFVHDLRSMLALTGLTLLCFFGFSLLGSEVTVDPLLLFTNGVVLLFVTAVAYGLYKLARHHRSIQHFEALMALQQKALAVDTRSELDQTLLEVARQIVHPLDAEEVTIFRYDKEQQLLHQIMSQPDTTRGSEGSSHMFRLGEGIAGYVAQHREPYRCPDTTFDARFDADSPRGHRIRSLIAAPIVADNQLLGVISADGPVPNHFDDNDLQLLLAFGNYLANRLQRARLLDALRVLGQSFDEAQEDAYGRILDELKRVIPYDSASLFLRYDNQLRAREHRGYPNPDKMDDARIPVEDDLFQEMASARKPLIVNDAQENEKFRKYGDADHVGSWLGVPLIIEGEVRGVLSIDNKQADYFSQSDIEFAAIFAHHAALAIARTEYNQKLEEWVLETGLHAEQLEAVNQFSTEVNVDLQLQEILSVTVQRVAEWFEVPRCAIALIEDGVDYAEVIAHWPDKQGRGARIPLDSAVAQHILRHKEPLAIEDAQNDPLLHEDGIRQVVHKHDIRSMLIVPIPIREKVVGTIGLDVMNQKRAFTSDEIEWTKRIAHQAGLAINNARQRDQWHRRATRRANYLRRALEASKKVAAVRRGDDALRAIARNLRRMFDYDSVILFPYLAADEAFEQPVIAGSLRSEAAVQSKVVSQSRVAQLIHHPDPYYFTSDSANDTLLKGPFVDREGIASSGFVRLAVADETLGLLFVNSCTPHNFSEEEKDAVFLFANLAALAIRNVRHYAHLQSELGELEMLLATQHDNGETRSRTKQFEEIAEILLKQGYDSVAIYPYDPLARQFDVPTLLGDVIHYEDIIGAVRQEGTVVGRRLTEGKENHFTNTPQKPDDLHAGEFVKREGIQASASLRLRSNGRLFGLLFVNKKEPFHFSTKRKHYLKMTAMKLATIQREVCERRYNSEQSEHLTQIRRKVGSTLNLNEVRDEIYRGLWKMFGEDALPALLMYDEADEKLRLLYTDALAERIDVPDEQARTALNLDEGICGWVARECKAANVPDVRQNDHYLCMHSATRSELAVPIIGRDDQLVGVLDVESPQLRRFNEGDERWLHQVASEIASNVWNAEQYERRGRLLEAFQSSITPIKSSRVGMSTLEAILSAAANLTDSHLATLQQLNDDRLCLEAVHPTEYHNKLKASIGECLPMDDPTVTVEAARTQKPQLINDVSKCGYFKPSGLKKTGSELAVPILDENGRTWGVLNVECRAANAFDREDVRALTNLADLVSVALQTARRADELARADAVAVMGAWQAFVCHDVNRALGDIRLAVGLLRSLDLTPDVIPYLDDIESWAERIALPQGLEDKRGIRNPSDLNRVIEDVVQEFEPELNAAGSSVQLTTLLDASVQVQLHDYLLSTFLKHLLYNAHHSILEHTEAGHILLKTEVENNLVVIRVSDNGGGVPRDIADQLFTQGVQRADGSGKGTGLLLISYFLEAVGGSIEQEENGKGEGACFTLRIPVACDEGEGKEDNDDAT